MFLMIHLAEPKTIHLIFFLMMNHLEIANMPTLVNNTKYN